MFLIYLGAAAGRHNLVDRVLLAAEARARIMLTLLDRPASWRSD